MVGAKERKRKRKGKDLTRAMWFIYNCNQAAVHRLTQVLAGEFTALGRVVE